MHSKSTHTYTTLVKCHILLILYTHPLHYTIHTLCRRFREFAELNSQIKQNLKGNHLRSSLPEFPEKTPKFISDHNSVIFIAERSFKLQVCSVHDMYNMLCGIYPSMLHCVCLCVYGLS